MNGVLPATWAAWTVFGAAAASSCLATGVVWFVARRRFLAHPNERSSHHRPTPTGGGLGMTAAVVLTLPAVAWAAGVWELAWTAIPVLGACAVGFADDLDPLPASRKFTVLLLAACTALGVARAGYIDLPFAEPFDLAWFRIAAPLSLAWLALFPNAFNFMDGIDGIGAATALVSGAAYSLYGAVAGDMDTALLGAVTAGAAAGFLPWNFPRARIFMGDAGSLPLGLLLALTALTAGTPAEGRGPAVDFPASLVLLGPFVFDVAFTLVRRAARGERLAIAHREHLYQRLSRLVGSHAPVTLLYAAFSVAMAFAAGRYGRSGDLGKVLSLTLPLAAMLAFAWLVLRLERARERAGTETA